MRVLMCGPGRGHNVQRFFKWFNENASDHQFFYYHYNKAIHYNLKQFEKIETIDRISIIQLIRAIKKVDLIWVHNWTPWQILLCIILFKNKKTVLTFNFWSEKLPLELLNSNSIKSKFYKYFFTKCDTLQTSWFGVKNHADKFDHPNSVLIRWGFEKEYFRDAEKSALSEFSKDFISKLEEEDSYKFFVPKTIGFPNRQDLMIQAAKLLLDRGLENFKIYLWKGNYIDMEFEDKLKLLIKENKLEEQVEIVSHPFLENQDIVQIWKTMDAGLQLCDQDQLSSAFTEPQLFKKVLIASDIASYRLYNEKYNCNVPLISNKDLEGIATLMEQAISGKLSDPVELEKRATIIHQYYNFEKNMPEILNLFQSLRS